jgi:ABC-type uncharacterized transport system substrate-binding protein
MKNKMFLWGGGLLTVFIVTVLFFMFKPAALAPKSGPDKTTVSKYSGKKIIYIDSYHQGYQWSDTEEQGAKDVLKDTGADLKFVFMDTNRHPDVPWAEQRAQEIKNQIDNEKPDAIIAADDAAVKYIIQPFFKDAAIPVVFCGVNWDASGYGMPYSNVTGMVEVSSVPELISRMKDYAKGVRIGYIAGDVLTNHKEPTEIKKKFVVEFSGEEFPSTYKDWEKSFLALQAKSDLIFFYSNAGINDWNKDQAVAFLLANAKVPVGTTLDWMMDYAHIGFTKVAQEQGDFAARTVLRVFDGESPANIPIVSNQQGKLMLNMKLANAMGLVFKTAMVKNAVILDQ